MNHHPSLGLLLLAAQVLFAALLVTTSPRAAVQGKRLERNRAEFQETRRRQRIEAGQRHLELGVDCRKKGLVSQAAREILLAVEVSERQNPGANTVLSYMRRLDESFWKKRTSRPSEKRAIAWAKKSAKLRRKDLDESFDLGLAAGRKRLEEEALAEFEHVLRSLDGPLVFDGKERIETPFGTVPIEASAPLRERAVLINEELYLPDEFLSSLDEWPPVYEVTSPTLRVRTLTDLDEARELHLLGEALFAQLREALGGVPDRRLNLFVFPERERYEWYLDAVELSGHKGAAGVADGRSFVAVLCSEARDEDARNALALHELTHLFEHGLSPAVFPSWYREGVAEAWGGPGTFRWEGGEFQGGGLLREDLRQRLREHALPLGEFLVADALGLLNSDRERATTFYAQSWAFVRFMREGAGKVFADRFLVWETLCRGSAKGAPGLRHNSRDARETSAEFERFFAEDLGDLEEAFLYWLKSL